MYKSIGAILLTLLFSITSANAVEGYKGFKLGMHELEVDDYVNKQAYEEQISIGYPVPYNGSDFYVKYLSGAMHPDFTNLESVYPAIISLRYTDKGLVYNIDLYYEYKPNVFQSIALENALKATYSDGNVKDTDLGGIPYHKVNIFSRSLFNEVVERMSADYMNRL